MRADVSKLREDYRQHGLHRADLADDPIAQFDDWFHGWLAIEPFDAAAMTVATAGRRRPARRPVRAVPGLRPAGLRLLHELHERQGHPARRQPACCAVLRLARPGSPGAGARAPSSASTTQSPTGTGPAVPVGADSAPGPRTRARSWRTGPSSTGTWPTWSDRFGDGDVPRPDFWGGFRVVHQRGRVLAGPDRPPARPLPLPPQRPQPHRLGDRPPVAVTGRPAGPGSGGGGGRRQRWGATSAATRRRWSRSWRSSTCR